MNVHLALINKTVLFLMDELNRVLYRNYMVFPVAVDIIHQRAERGGFAGCREKGEPGAGLAALHREGHGYGLGVGCIFEPARLLLHYCGLVLLRRYLQQKVGQLLSRNHLAEHRRQTGRGLQHRSLARLQDYLLLRLYFLNKFI